MKKIFLVIFLVILGVVVIFGYWANIFLPKKIKIDAENFVKENFDKILQISTIKINIIKGIKIANATVLEKNQTPYLVINELDILPLWPSFLTKNKIIISCKISNAYFNLSRNQQGQFNIPEIKTAAGKNLVLLNSLEIKKLRLDFVDTKVNFKKTFSDLYLAAQIGPAEVNFKLKWLDTILSQGVYYFNTSKLKINCLLYNINLTEFTPYINGLQLNQGLLTKADIIWEINATHNFQGKIQLNNLAITQNNKEFQGNLTADFSAAISPLLKKTSYYIDGALENGQLNNLPIINTLYNVSTRFNLDGEKINFLNFSGYLTPLLNKKENYLAAKGAITYIGEPTIILETQGNMQTARFIKIMNQLSSNPIWKTITTNNTGTIDFKGNLNSNLTKKEISYLFNYTLKNADINTIKNINAQGVLEKNILTFSKCSFNYKNIDFLVNGAINDLSGQDKTLVVDFQSESALNKFIILLNELGGSSLPFLSTLKNPGGNLAITGKVEGKLHEKLFQYTINYQLNNGQINDLSQIQAQGIIDNTKFLIKSCSLNYKNFPFTLLGNIENFSSPKISLVAQSDLLTVVFLADSLSNNIIIKELSLKSPNSKVISQGNMKTDSPFQINLTGKGNLNLTDIIKITNILNPKTQPALTKLNPQGVFNLEFTAKKDTPSDWQIKVKGLSDKLTIYNINGQNVSFDLLSNKNELIISPLLAKVINGKLDLRSKFDFKNNKAVFNVIANDISLSQLQKEVNLGKKAKDITGMLNLQADFENSSLTQWDKLSGDGKITISNGNFCHINFLKGLGEFLFIPDFEDIKFKKGYSDIIFKKDAILFDDLEMQSTEMSLKGAGKIYLDGKIDFMLFPEFNPMVVAASSGLQKVFTGILGKSGLVIKAEGTLLKPKYSTKPLLFSPIQGIKKFFKDLSS